MPAPRTKPLTALELFARIRARTAAAPGAAPSEERSLPTGLRLQAPPALVLEDLSELHANAQENNRRWNLVGLPPAPAGTGPRARIEPLLLRVLARYTLTVVEFTAPVTRSINKIVEALEALSRGLAQLHGHVAALTARVPERGEVHFELLGEIVHSARALSDRIEVDCRAPLKELEIRVGRLERARGDVGHAPAEPAFDARQFCERFRGSEEAIADRLRGYVEAFRAAGDVLDLGCGRGEMLRLLAAAGIRARGVDGDAGLVAACRAADLDVVHADLFHHLAATPDGSVGGIVCAQVIEHFDAPDQLRLVAEIARVLEPGAPLVIETINPQSFLAWSRSYSLDPTHVRMLHPETLAFALEGLGFDGVRIEFHANPASVPQLPRLTLPESVPERDAFNAALDHVNWALFGPVDYAVHARRRERP